MADNSSSTYNASPPPSSLSSSPPPSSLSSSSSSINLYSFLHNCLRSPNGTICILAYTVTSILVLLPQYILVLYLGVRQWRAGTAASHSDFLTYNMVVTELMSILGSILICCGIYAYQEEMMTQGILLYTANLGAQMYLHILICLERYLAVVHPITYWSLRKTKGIRIRKVSIGCFLPLCLAQMALLYLEDEHLSAIISFCVMVAISAVVCFCSLSVLRVLIRLRPGEGGGGRQQVDQSKLRAFYTIMAILAVLLLKLGATVLVACLYPIPQLGPDEKCFVWMSAVWFSLPSSLVLPLLLLLREGKLLCLKNNNG